jgi:FkbH-like protein
VRNALPMVRVFQVPKALSEYAGVVKEIRELFLAGGVSVESRSKTAQYRQRQAAIESSAKFATQEEYLASLDLRVQVVRDDRANVPRISELTLKSNQFNLTTLRQSPAEIQQRMEGDSGTVYSLTVLDRFGSAGLTGVALVSWDAEVARLDAFLMSCRVIGRGVEFCFWPLIVDDAKQLGCLYFEAEYRPTNKNAQVADFCERLGLEPRVGVDGVKRYRAALDDLKPPPNDWIKVIE